MRQEIQLSQISQKCKCFLTVNSQAVTWRKDVGFEVLTPVVMKSTVFWVIAP
jgi:hypothetical protein